MKTWKTADVFGVSPYILEESYIDRAKLDIKMKRLLEQRKHITLYGASKCGKSWFRQKNIPNALVVQSRFGMSVLDIYTDALAQLDIKFIVEETKEKKVKGIVEATGEIGVKLLSKFSAKVSAEGERSTNTKFIPVGKDINDLRNIAEIINASEKRLVIEDFHYLSTNEKNRFAFDLKTLWDYNCMVIVIGVWSQSGYLTTLNTDLTGRTTELSIIWSKQDLNAVIDKGCEVLNVSISNEIKKNIITDSFGNVGILQTLLSNFLFQSEIYETLIEHKQLNEMERFIEAGSEYASQLNAVYLKFAKTVSAGIRRRAGSTEIYAHALAVIMDSEDEKLISGLHIDEIFRIANERQPRIIKPNLVRALKKVEELQVDEENRGLVIAFNEGSKEIIVVDRQLLFYRKHRSMDWPWEDIIKESEEERVNTNEVNI